jgi:hypothetical protein
VTVEDAQLHALAHSLDASPAATMAAVTATTIRAVKNIQREARQLAPTGPHIPRYAGKITTSSRHTVMSITAEVGPLQSGQGALGEVLEFGSANNPPHPHVMPAADHEVPVWLRYLTRAAGTGI